MKKVLSIALVIVMILAMSIPAFATTVTVNDPNNVLTDHTFVAYQILAGDYDEDTKTLSNITWGAGVDYEGLVEDLTSADHEAVFGDDFDALDASKVSCPSDLAGILKNYTQTSAQIEKFVEIALQNLAGTGTNLEVGDSVDLPYGYYLVVDTTDVDGADAVANAALLQVAGEDIEINAKVEKPTLEKKVKENADYTADAGYGAGYNDVATYSIGDVVPFALYSTVPDLSQYTTYELSFHDNMSKGLTLDVDSITVTIGGVELEKGTTTGTEHTGDYHAQVTYIDISNETTATPAGNTVFTVHLPDLKSIQIDDGNGGTRAVTKGDKIVVSYNATLDADAVVGLPGNLNAAYLEFTNNPDIGGDGKTPEDKVIVFTLGLELDKVDGANTAKKLKGVEFAIWKDTAKSAFAVANKTTKKFAGWVLTSTLTDTNNDGVVDPYDYTSTENDAIHVTDINGNVTVAGLDNGTYYIEETKELAGYNAIVGLMELTINSSTVNGQTWDFTPASALTALENDTDSDWLAEKQIVNYGGTVLPETGGMGTVIFVSVGFMLILGASVILITRKKMSVYEN